MPSKTEQNEDKNPHFKYLEKYAAKLDSSIRIPGTEVRFGWDPVLGLIPVVGDTVSLGFSVLLIFYFLKNGGTRKMALKMGGNALLDATIGSIPILGTLFDFVYKANDRNYQILKEHHESGAENERIGKFLLTFILILFLLGLLSISITFFILKFVFSFFQV